MKMGWIFGKRFNLDRGVLFSAYSAASPSCSGSRLRKLFFGREVMSKVLSEAKEVLQCIAELIASHATERGMRA